MHNRSYQELKLQYSLHLRLSQCHEPEYSTHMYSSASSPCQASTCFCVKHNTVQYCVIIQYSIVFRQIRVQHSTAESRGTPSTSQRGGCFVIERQARCNLRTRQGTKCFKIASHSRRYLDRHRLACRPIVEGAFYLPVAFRLEADGLVTPKQGCQISDSGQSDCDRQQRHILARQSVIAGIVHCCRTSKG